jgi:hypothetical protein
VAVVHGLGHVADLFYDDGAFGNTVERHEDLAPDFIHLTVKGQAHAAEVAWAAMQKAGLIPQG